MINKCKVDSKQLGSHEKITLSSNPYSPKNPSLKLAKRVQSCNMLIHICFGGVYVTKLIEDEMDLEETKVI